MKNTSVAQRTTSFADESGTRGSLFYRQKRPISQATPPRASRIPEGAPHQKKKTQSNRVLGQPGSWNRGLIRQAVGVGPERIGTQSGVGSKVKFEKLPSPLASPYRMPHE